MKKSLPLLLAAFLMSPAQAADFTPLSKSTAAQLLDPANHRQPTIVTLWSSDCSHCKKNLQLLSTLVKSNKQLRVITVAAEPDSAILGPLLDRFQLPGPRYAYGSDNPDAIAFAIDPSWAGELPRTFLFNGAGQKEKVSGVISAQMAEKAPGLRS